MIMFISTASKRKFKIRLNWRLKFLTDDMELDPTVLCLSADQLCQKPAAAWNFTQRVARVPKCVVTESDAWPNS